MEDSRVVPFYHHRETKESYMYLFNIKYQQKKKLGKQLYIFSLVNRGFTCCSFLSLSNTSKSKLSLSETDDALHKKNKSL